MNVLKTSSSVHIPVPSLPLISAAAIAPARVDEPFSSGHSIQELSDFQDYVVHITASYPRHSSSVSSDEDRVKSEIVVFDTQQQRLFSL